jgi:hypothetical protein
MPAKKKSAVFLSVLALLALAEAPRAAAESRYVHEHEGVSYPYLVDTTGENHTFEFEKNPGREGGRLRALGHVFRSVYGDDTVESNYSQVFPKEGAKCYVFEARFYTYRGCFLPNDYSPDKPDRFWGFVTRLPNFSWFLTRQILPAALLLGGIAWWWRKR